MSPDIPHRRSAVLRLPALLVALLVAMSAGAAAPAAAAADRTVIVGGRAGYTFYGRGWGHGVGMSQHGARGRALAGQTAAEILAHYYSGTHQGTKDPATPIRVLVLNGFAATAARPAVVYGRGGAWTIDGVATAFPAGARVVLAPTAAGARTFSLRVVSATGTRLHRATVSGSVVVRPAAAATVLQLASKRSTFDSYRGLLRIHLTATVRVVNVVGLDLYLRGVVPAEMPASWPGEALRAQAIAARSYAAGRIVATGQYDVTDDTRTQVYRGAEGEAAAPTAAIEATTGIVLKSGTSIANTLFHSTGGGATEHNENVFVSASGAIVAGPVSYLRGKPDRQPDGTPFDAGAPLATWKTATYTRQELSTMFGKDARTAVGTVTRLDLSRRGVSGRLISVTLAGTAGTKTVSGAVFRAVFNANRPAGHPQLRSTLFDRKPIP